MPGFPLVSRVWPGGVGVGCAGRLCVLLRVVMVSSSGEAVGGRCLPCRGDSFSGPAVVCIGSKAAGLGTALFPCLGQPWPCRPTGPVSFLFLPGGTLLLCLQWHGFNLEALEALVVSDRFAP